MPTARELLDGAERRLTQARVPSPRVDAELLLAHVVRRPRALLRGSGEIPSDQAEAFTVLVERRSERVPLQHLTGTAPFRHLELAVGPGVFVPRPETELLVDAVLDHLRGVARRGAEEAGAGTGGPILVDLCTGSGALALALATELPGCTVHAVELDDQAAAWARRNLDVHADDVAKARSQLHLHVADATRAAEPGGPLASLAGRVAVVVTNPPYIPDDAVPRDPEVRDHDPVRSLFGGPDGLDVVRALVGQAAALLRPGGLLAIEHADVQGEAAGETGVPGVLRASGAWRAIADHEDLAGLPRFTTALRADPAGSPSPHASLGGRP